jgi:hypothetical protein
LAEFINMDYKGFEKKVASSMRNWVISFVIHV